VLGDKGRSLVGVLRGFPLNSSYRTHKMMRSGESGSRKGMVIFMSNCPSKWRLMPIPHPLSPFSFVTIFILFSNIKFPSIMRFLSTLSSFRSMNIDWNILFPRLHFFFVFFIRFGLESRVVSSTLNLPSSHSSYFWWGEFEWEKKRKEHDKWLDSGGRKERRNRDKGSWFQVKEREDCVTGELRGGLDVAQL